MRSALLVERDIARAVERGVRVAWAIGLALTAVVVVALAGLLVDLDLDVAALGSTAGAAGRLGRGIRALVAVLVCTKEAH